MKAEPILLLYTSLFNETARHEIICSSLSAARVLA